MHRSAPAETIEDVADIAMHRLTAAFARRVQTLQVPQPATSGHRASPHRVRKAENRMGDERRSNLIRGRAGGRLLEKTPKRDRSEHGRSEPAHRGPASAEGDETS
jgi:hypothetical protein